jgi:hypothetical protein
VKSKLSQQLNQSQIGQNNMKKYNFDRLPFREWRFYSIAKEDSKKFRNAANDWCARQDGTITIKCNQLVRIDADGNKIFLGFEVYKND